MDPARGQIWVSTRTGQRYRVQGFCVSDGWVKVREVGGERLRASYPPGAFRNGAFRKVG